MGRAPCCDKANVKKGPWSPEEDVTLKDYIDKNGTGGNWIALPQKIGLKRCGKSCRLRWLNYLRPNIKHGGFTEEEDKIICSLYISIGSRWSVIAAQLPGRTDNDIKNYWNTRLKKKLLGKRKQTLMDRLSSLPPHQDPKHGNKEVEDNPYLQNLSNSAIERLQLHVQLQTTFSFYNNPTSWPNNNSSHMQEKMNHQTMQTMNGRRIPMCPLVSEQKFESYNYPRRSTHIPKVQEFVDDMAQKTSIVEEHVNTQMISTFTQAELDELLMTSNKNVGFLPPSSTQMAPELFDCFKEMEGGHKDQMLWWSNDFDTNSASSSSWDSLPLAYPSAEMCQDFAVGFNNNVHQLLQ